MVELNNHENFPDVLNSSNELSSIFKQHLLPKIPEVYRNQGLTSCHPRMYMAPIAVDNLFCSQNWLKNKSLHRVSCVAAGRS